MIVSITPLPGTATELAAPPDIVWNGTVGDFTPDADRGLRSESPLETAILIALFTDAPVDAGELRYEHNGDFRGFPGDGIEGNPVGSKLWLYRRSELTDLVAMQVRAEIIRSLRVILDQEAAARIDVQVFPMKAENRLDALIEIFGRDGSRVYSNRFDLLWRGR